MQKLTIVLVVLAAIGFGSWYFFSQKNPSSPSAIPTPPFAASPTVSLPFTAHFLIFTDGTRRVFTDSRYHNLSSDIYISPEKPNSVMVNKANITWDGFFATLPMKLTKDCLTTGTGQNFCSNNSRQLMFYINGESAPDALSRPINPGDRLLVSFGQSEAVTDQLSQLNEVN